MRGRSTSTVWTSEGADWTARAWRPSPSISRRARFGRRDQQRAGGELTIADLERRFSRLGSACPSSDSARESVQRAVVRDDVTEPLAHGAVRIARRPRVVTSSFSSVAAASRIVLSSIVLTSMLFAIPHRPRAVVVRGQAPDRIRSCCSSSVLASGGDRTAGSNFTMYEPAGKRAP